jgi:hypothetical protein
MARLWEDGVGRFSFINLRETEVGLIPPPCEWEKCVADRTGGKGRMLMSSLGDERYF